MKVDHYGVVNFHVGATRTQQPEHAAVFATWRLPDSLPGRGEIPRPAFALTEGQRFLAFDRQLDQALTGPVWLENPLVAEGVAQTLFLADQQWDLCRMLAWVIMPNHVHVLMAPLRPLHEVTRAIRRTSARLANEALRRPGCSLWYEGSHEYWVRHDSELQRIATYIEMNPVNAGLAARRETFHWSSAYPTMRPSAGGLLDVEHGLLGTGRSEIERILAA